MARRDKRLEIMKAAEELFKDRRFHEITLDEVAEHARVGKGTIYLHFKDKDDLFFQTATSGFDGLCELIERKVPGNAPFAEQLLRVGVEISSFFQSRRQLLRMMQTEEGRMIMCRGENRERFMAQRRKLVAAVAGIIRRGLAERCVRSDLPPEALAGFLLGMLRTRAHELAGSGGPTASHESVIDLFLNGAGRSERPGRQNARRNP